MELEQWTVKKLLFAKVSLGLYLSQISSYLMFQNSHLSYISINYDVLIDSYWTRIGGLSYCFTAFKHRGLIRIMLQ